MEIIYRACDGTIFESERECYKYEQTTLEKIKAYNDAGERIFLTVRTDIDEIDYIYFPDEQSVKAFEQILKESYFNFTVGAWYWDSEIHEWANLDNEIKKIAKTIKILGLANKII